jgi:hypothetical protein
MVALKTEEKVQKKEAGIGITIEKMMPLLFLGLLIIGVIGYFALRNLSIDFIFAHVGGFGIIGLFGCLAGIISKKKGYDYWQAFLLGLVLPVILGFIAVLVIFPPDPELACGGSVSLGAAILIVIFYTFAKYKNIGKQAES